MERAPDRHWGWGTGRLRGRRQSRALGARLASVGPASRVLLPEYGLSWIYGCGTWGLASLDSAIVGDDTGDAVVAKGRQGEESLSSTTPRGSRGMKRCWEDGLPLRIPRRAPSNCQGTGHSNSGNAAPIDGSHQWGCTRQSTTVLPSRRPLVSACIYQGGNECPWPSSLPFPPKKAIPVLWRHTILKVSRPVMAPSPNWVRRSRAAQARAQPSRPLATSPNIETVDRGLLSCGFLSQIYADLHQRPAGVATAGDSRWKSVCLLVVSSSPHSKAEQG